MAAGYGSIDNLRNELAIAHDILQTPENVPLRVGVGFLVWQLEKDPVRGEQMLSVSLDASCQAVWLAFGEDIGHWIEFIRVHDPRTGTADSVKIFVQISTVDQALCALDNWKADVIVAQGNEAGGHGLSNALPLLTLLPLLRSVIETSASGRQNTPPLLAAGGLATGSHVASLLTLGASGVVLGTRFLLCPESLYTEDQRKALLVADSNQSVRTMAFDQARVTLGWPQGVDGRGLRNGIGVLVARFKTSDKPSSIPATVIDYENGLDLQTLRSRFIDGSKTGDRDRIVIWAGSGVGLMNAIKSAEVVTKELHEKCFACLENASMLIQDK